MASSCKHKKTSRMKAVARVMGLLLGCSATTEAFCQSLPVRGGPGLARAALASAHQVPSSVYASSSASYYANATTVTAARDQHHRRRLHREIRCYKRQKKSEESSLDFDMVAISPMALASSSRRKTKSSLGIVNSSLVRGKRARKSSLGKVTPSSLGLAVTLHSPSELNCRAGAAEPRGPPGPVVSPALVPEPASQALPGGGKKPRTCGAYYKYLDDYYCKESEPVTGKKGGWEGIDGVIIASPPLEESSLQSRDGEGRTFRKIEVRATWRECKGKSLQRSAAPIVDLVGLAVPLLFIVGFSLMT